MTWDLRLKRVQVHVDEGAKLALVGIKMTAQVGVLGDESAKGLADGRAADFDSRLLACILTQWRGNVDLGHG